MSTSEPTQTQYRETILPGIGKVKVPAGMTDAEVIAELETAEAEDARQDAQQPVG